MARKDIVNPLYEEQHAPEKENRGLARLNDKFATQLNDLRHEGEELQASWTLVNGVAKRWKDRAVALEA